jgi:hypothetical protein
MNIVIFSLEFRFDALDDKKLDDEADKRKDV